MKRRRPHAFTLMEVVLAIALTAVVVYLLTTAIELYLFSVDASRTRVESAQLARTLLDQIADDLTSTRLYTPQAGGGGQFGGPPVGGGPGPNGGGSPGSAGGGPNANQGAGLSGGGGVTGGSGSGGSTGGGPSGGGLGPMSPTSSQGLFGTEEVIRVDRGPSANWERATRLVDPQETTSKYNMPTTVRYYFLSAQHVSTERAAREGVSDERSAANVTGLYRETIPTASISPQDDPLAPSAQPQKGATVELLAPEVVGFTMQYFDGKQFLDAWDSIRANGLPVGVEITITLAEPSFQSTPDADEQQRRDEGRYSANELVEYRRFVYLPLIEQGQPAQPLLPGAQNGGQGNQGGGQNGNNGNGNNANGNNGGANNGNATNFQTTP